MKYKPIPETCKCGNPRRPGQRLCKSCHAAYMKNWRSKRVFVLREEVNA